MGNRNCFGGSSAATDKSLTERKSFMANPNTYQKVEEEQPSEQKNQKQVEDKLPPSPILTKEPSKTKKSPYEVTLNDFTTKKCLARGSFGKVLLVQNKDTKQFYAMKTLKKADIINRNQIENALNEKMILQNSDHPFVVKLKFAFQNEYNIYFIMEYMAGGELFHHIKTRKKFSEQTVVYYSSQVILALEYLHEKLNFIYRDLKPENILIDEEGNIKLSDFGLAKSTTFDKNYSFCGTPEYLAPEIINNKGHSKPVDFWTLGCFIFEMLNGSPPFRHPQRSMLYSSIIQNRYVFPPEFSPEAKDLIANLLVTDPEKRFTIPQLKAHPFFKNVNWVHMLQKKYQAPFKPKLTNSNDTSYHFDANNQISETPQPRRIEEGMQDKFIGITYRGENKFE